MPDAAPSDGVLIAAQIWAIRLFRDGRQVVYGAARMKSRHHIANPAGGTAIGVRNCIAPPPPLSKRGYRENRPNNRVQADQRDEHPQRRHDLGFDPAPPDSGGPFAAGRSPGRGLRRTVLASRPGGLRCRLRCHYRIHYHGQAHLKGSPRLSDRLPRFLPVSYRKDCGSARRRTIFRSFPGAGVPVPSRMRVKAWRRCDSRRAEGASWPWTRPGEDATGSSSAQLGERTGKRLCLSAALQTGLIGKHDFQGVSTLSHFSRRTYFAVSRAARTG